MPIRHVDFHHVANSMQRPMESFSANRHPFLVLSGEGGKEIHYGRGDTVHDDLLKVVDRSRVRHAGSLFVDPVIPYVTMGITRVSWDHPEFGIAPPDVIMEVKNHVREHVRRMKGPNEANSMRFNIMKATTRTGLEYE